MMAFVLRGGILAVLTALSCPAVVAGQTRSADAPVQTRSHPGDGPVQQGPPPPQPPHERHPADEPADRTPRPPGQAPPAGLPPITDQDRRAAFPEINGQHAVHDDAVHSFVLFDQLEWQGGSGASGGSWDSKGWIGRDVNRFWFRTEGEGSDGRVGSAQAHALYGRAIHRWWDLVVGVRQDFRPGPAQPWAALGIQGLAPYWFEVEATAYIGASARTHFRFETEYELLLTNRLILQPLVEVEIYGKSDPEHGTGAGLSTIDGGLRLRYEVRREFAPYVGVAWNRKFLGTARLAAAAGEDTSVARLTLGARVWF